MISAVIDLNVRVCGNLTYVGYEDMSGEPVLGLLVHVFEREAELAFEREPGLEGIGRIVGLDEDLQLVYLKVDWCTLALPDHCRPTEP